MIFGIQTYLKLATGRGIEPQLTDPKSAVLSASERAKSECGTPHAQCWPPRSRIFTHQAPKTFLITFILPFRHYSEWLII